jgi:hypothetical protein
VKAGTLLALFAPFLFTSLCSPYALVAVPLLLERFLSTNPNYWGMQFHYSMAVAPVLVIASADGMANLTRFWHRRVHSGGRVHTGGVLIAATAVMLVGNVLVARQQTPTSALALLTRHTDYLPAADISAADGALAQVPPAVSVAAPTNLEAPLSDRNVIEDLTPEGVAGSRYLVVDVTDPSCCSEVKTATTIAQTLDPALAALTPVYYDDGWLVAKRPLSGIAPSNAAMDPLSIAQSTRIAAALHAWDSAVFGVFVRVPTCVAVLRGARGNPDSAPRCFAARDSTLLARAGAVHSIFLSAVAHSVGPCLQLLHASESSVLKVTAGLIAIDAAGKAASLSGVAVAYRSFGALESSTDPLGLLDRFSILCTPRAGPSA